MKTYVGCLGCEPRKLDAQRVVDYLTANGIETTDRPESADRAIIVACAVNLQYRDDSIEYIKKTMARMRPSARLIIGGCLPSIDPDSIKSIPHSGAFSPKQMSALDGAMGEEIRIPIEQVPVPNITLYDEPLCEKTASDARNEYDKAMRGYKVKVAEGCFGQCSYCMIRKATGPLRSEPVEKLLGQIERGAMRCEESIMIIAGDTGAYGRDIGSSFPALLDRALDIRCDYRLFIDDLNVNWLVRDFEKYAKVFEKNKKAKKIVSISLPLQSGSDAVLKLMKRPYTACDATRALLEVRKRFPEISLGTHVMVGFPGETEEDFEKTREMLEKVNFDFILCFSYSEHNASESVKLPNKVPRNVIDRRLKTLEGMFMDKMKVFRSS